MKFHSLRSLVKSRYRMKKITQLRDKIKDSQNDAIFPSPVQLTVHTINILLKNQEAESIIENTSDDNEISFSQEAIEEIKTENDHLNDLKEHQEFLLKLLTNKDSFISIKNESNLGKGKSITNGSKFASKSNIILFDGDLEIDIAEIPKIINVIVVENSKNHQLKNHQIK